MKAPLHPTSKISTFPDTPPESTTERANQMLMKLFNRSHEVLRNPNSPFRFNSKGEDVSTELNQLFQNSSSRQMFISRTILIYPDLPEKIAVFIYDIYKRVYLSNENRDNLKLLISSES